MTRVTQNASPALSPSNSYGDPPKARAIPRIMFLERSETKPKRTKFFLSKKRYEKVEVIKGGLICEMNNHACT